VLDAYAAASDEGTVVLCQDELGPVAVKTYPGGELTEKYASFEPDYGRRGKCWTFGLFNVNDGHVLTHQAPARNGKEFVCSLEAMLNYYNDAKRIIIILDNLSVHHSNAVKLALEAYPHVELVFLPTKAPWLNLIERFWRPYKRIALKGKRFETTDELIAALEAATAYWNKYKKPYQLRKLKIIA
jgi:transposase